MLKKTIALPGGWKTILWLDKVNRPGKSKGRLFWRFCVLFLPLLSACSVTATLCGYLGLGAAWLGVCFDAPE